MRSKYGLRNASYASLGIGTEYLSPRIKRRVRAPNWENIINDIEAAIRKINGPSSGSDWKSKQQFYSDAAKDFRYFKDAWRNHAMHSREYYGAPEALTIINHVKEFMKHLAEKGLCETEQNLPEQ